MEKSINGKSQQRIARTAGLLYTLMIPLAAFGMLYVPATLFVTGDMEKTVHNMVAHGGVFRLSILCAVIVQICHIFIVLLLYKLLRTVGRDMAALMVIFMLVSIPVTMVNELGNYAIVLLTTNSSMPLHDTGVLIDLLFRVHGYGILISGIFWGLWLFPMGYLVYKSTFLPKSIGVLLIIACFGYVIDSMMKLVQPAYSSTVVAQIIGVTLYGELAFPLWLLIKGIHLKKWEEHVGKHDS